MVTGCQLFVALLLVLSYCNVGVFSYYRTKPVTSCNVKYLKHNIESGHHLQRLLQVYDLQFFNRSCSENSTSETEPNLWDQFLPKPLNLVIFYHIGLFRNTPEVVEEMLFAMELSKLLKDASLYVGISGVNTKKLPPKHGKVRESMIILKRVLPLLPPKSVFVGQDTLDTGEFATYNGVLNFLNTQHANFSEKDTLVLYMHSKGTAWLYNYGRDWRRHMLFFDVWLWRWAVIMLQHYQAYGVNYIPTWGISGNFWWARLSFLRSLNQTTLIGRQAWIKDRSVGERWWMIEGHSRRPRDPRQVCCLVNSGIEHHEYFYPGHVYASYKLYHKLAQYVYAHVQRRPGVTNTPLPPPLPPVSCYVVCSGENAGVCGVNITVAPTLKSKA